MLITKEMQAKLDKLNNSLTNSNNGLNIWISDEIRKKFRPKLKKEIKLKMNSKSGLISFKDYKNIVINFEVCFKNFDFESFENLIFIQNMIKQGLIIGKKETKKKETKKKETKKKETETKK